MKSILILPVITLLAAGCQSPESKETASDTAAQKPLLITIEPGSADVHYLWQPSFEDSSGKLRMERKQPLPADSLKPEFIIQHLNNSYPKIRLLFDRISNDTIFVKISHSRYLTQQMGSTGADMYLTEATYDLSELTGIEYVNFSFKAGDHAAPGTYCKTDFLNVLH